jgi:DNA-binding response OmpR family regulator
MERILICEDDIELRGLFASVLKRQGYHVDCASNGKEGLEMLSQEYYDLVISDIMMPVMDGYQFVKRIREIGYQFPVMMITAKDAFEDMKLGFLLGSDDYMVKPINVNEMVIRVSALLRRFQMNKDRKISIGNTTLEYDACLVSCKGEDIVLALKEFMLLYKMASNIGKIFTRQQLLQDIWGYDVEGDTHTVDVHIERLRKKFRDNPDFDIVTIRGIGYKVIKK